MRKHRMLFARLVARMGEERLSKGVVVFRELVGGNCFNSEDGENKLMECVNMSTYIYCIYSTQKGYIGVYCRSTGGPKQHRRRADGAGGDRPRGTRIGLQYTENGRRRSQARLSEGGGGAFCVKGLGAGVLVGLFTLSRKRENLKALLATTHILHGVRLACNRRNYSVV